MIFEKKGNPFRDQRAIIHTIHSSECIRMKADDAINIS